MKRTVLSIIAVIVTVLAAMPASAIQCVPYAREASGLNLKGNAWEWWNAAAGLYERGRTAKEGAVLVFSRQGAMRYGHVSVVTRVVSNRLVLVDHANWAPAGSDGRGKVTQAVPVLDVSAKNDWSQVRVWYRPADDYGNKVYKAEGFVFKPAARTGAPRPAVERVALTRAAKIMPTDKALSRYAEQAPAPQPPVVHAAATTPAPAPVVHATPAVHTATVVQPAVVQPAVVQPAATVVAENTLSHPSTDDLISVARHAFRPHAAQQAKAATVDDFIFN